MVVILFHPLFVHGGWNPREVIQQDLQKSTMEVTIVPTVHL